jgi:hypothetical protein
MLVAAAVTLTRSVSIGSINTASLDGMLSLMFAGAWWTTRRPSEYRNPWAVSASLICVVTGGYLVWDARAAGRFSRSGAISAIIGLAGLYLYSQGGRAPRRGLGASMCGTVEQPKSVIEKHRPQSPID